MKMQSDMSKMKKAELEAMLNANYQELEEAKAENKRLQANIERLIKTVENLTERK